jgi:large subunit ribosomal protein L19
MKSIYELNQSKKKKDIPNLRPGMTVKVHQKIIEAGKERTQIFEGMILSLHGGSSLTATITVRKIASGIGVERIFPIHSPLITNIVPVKQARVRRAKLFHLRKSKKRLQETVLVK